MDNKNLSISEAASMLMGAGFIQISTSTIIGLGLIGTGVFLKILIAVLQKKGIEVMSNEG